MASCALQCVRISLNVQRFCGVLDHDLTGGSMVVTVSPGISNPVFPEKNRFSPYI